MTVNFSRNYNISWSSSSSSSPRDLVYALKDKLQYELRYRKVGEPWARVRPSEDWAGGAGGGRDRMCRASRQEEGLPQVSLQSPSRVETKDSPGMEALPGTLSLHAALVSFFPGVGGPLKSLPPCPSSSISVPDRKGSAPSLVLSQV